MKVLPVEETEFLSELMGEWFLWVVISSGKFFSSIGLCQGTLLFNVLVGFVLVGVSDEPCFRLDWNWKFAKKLWKREVASCAWLVFKKGNDMMSKIMYQLMKKYHVCLQVEMWIQFLLGIQEMLKLESLLYRSLPSFLDTFWNFRKNLSGRVQWKKVWILNFKTTRAWWEKRVKNEKCEKERF